MTRSAPVDIGGVEAHGHSPSAAGAERAASTGAERIAAAFGKPGRRAALMPYLMGGFPDVERSKAIGEAYADGGADLVELAGGELMRGR